MSWWSALTSPHGLVRMSLGLLLLSIVACIVLLAGPDQVCSWLQRPAAARSCLSWWAGLGAALSASAALLDTGTLRTLRALSLL